MIWIALAGGLGAVARYLSDLLITRNQKRLRGWATLIINVVGSFFLGLLVGWCTNFAGNYEIRLVIGVGFLGGYTTFSTACVEAAQLIRDRKYSAAALLTGAMLLASVTAAALGLWVILH